MGCSILFKYGTILVLSSQDNILKLNKPLLIHKIIGNKSGCHQIYNRMRAHSGHRQHKKVRYNYNTNADVVKQEVNIHYTIPYKINNELFELSLYKSIHRGWVLDFGFIPVCSY